MKAERDIQCEKEGEVDERSAEGVIEVKRTTAEACEEEDRCEAEDLESHFIAKLGFQQSSQTVRTQPLLNL